jgi:hypothetical protein
MPAIKSSAETVLDARNAAIVATVADTLDEVRERSDAMRDGRTIRAFLVAHPELLDDMGCLIRLEHLIFDLFDTEDGRPLWPRHVIDAIVDRAYGDR